MSFSIFQLLKALVFGKKRPVPLIRSLCYHLTRKDISDVKVITDGLYAVSQLSIKDQELMESLCSKALDLIKGQDSQDLTSVIRSMLTSLGQVGFLHKNLMDEITNWYLKQLKNNQGITDRDLLNFVFTFASLNYKSEDSGLVLDEAVKQIQVDTLDTIKRPLYVWSLAVLQKVTDTHLASVLNPDFASQILCKSENSKAQLG